MTALLLLAERALVWLAVIAAGAMMLLTSADASARYLFNAPIVGAYEITEKYLMPATVFLGFSWAYRGGVFIRVTFLVDRFPSALKRACDYVAWSISLACCGLFAWATARQAYSAMTEDTMLSSVALPLGPAYVIAPIGFFVICVMMLIDLPRVGKGDAMLFSQDAPTT